MFWYWTFSQIQTSWSWTIKYMKKYNNRIYKEQKTIEYIENT